MTSGLLISGQLRDVAGLRIVPPAGHGGPAWNQLGPEDYRMRPGAWTSKVVPHTTGGNWPQPILPGAGPAGHAQQIAEMWSGRDHDGGERVYSGAHLLVDFDGTVYCLADLVRHMAYHATSVNPTSVGIEMCTRPDGGIYEATLDATAHLIAALTWSGQPGSGLLPVPFQMARGPYRGDPLRRLEFAGKGMPGAEVVGSLGHRDQTSRRGRGDPGDAIFQRLAALGCEGVDYDGGEDLMFGRRRQERLNELDAKAGLAFAPLSVDGVCGPASLAAMQRHGFARWCEVA